MKNGSLPYDKKIESKIYEGILKGLSLTKIHDSISHWQTCPKTVQSLVNNYRPTIAEARVARDEKILGYAEDRMKAGSDKIIELALRSQVGWNPSVKIQETDEDTPDEAQDAISALMEKLGKGKDEEDG
jgi:hypothetical protein